MAGKLSFNLELTGAEKAAAQLRQVKGEGERLGNVKDAGFLRSLEAMSPAMARLNPHLVQMRNELQRLQQMSRLPQGTLAAFINSQLGIGAGQNTPNKAAYAAFWARTVPPIIPPPVISRGFNWQQAMLGAAVAPFHPWVGARGIAGAFGGGGAGGSGVTGALFGGGGFAPFAAAMLGVTVVTHALRLAFEGLKHAIEDGARLYQRAAKTAKSPERLFQIESMAKAIGLSPDEVEMLLLRGEHPLRGRGGAMLNVGGDRFGSGRGVMQTGGLQQLGNMSEYVSRANLSVAMIDMVAMGQAAKPLQEIFFNFAAATRELHVAFAQIATLMSPYLNLALTTFTQYLQVINMLLAPLIGVLQLLGQIPRGLPGNTVIPTGGTRPSFSAWERMGLIVGGGIGGNDYARQTAMNTKRIADHITGQRGIIGFNAGGLALFNLP